MGPGGLRLASQTYRSLVHTTLLKKKFRILSRTFFYELALRTNRFYFSVVCTFENMTCSQGPHVGTRPAEITRGPEELHSFLRAPRGIPPPKPQRAPPPRLRRGGHGAFLESPFLKHDRFLLSIRACSQLHFVNSRTSIF